MSCPETQGSLQERRWFLEEMDKELEVYHTIPVAWLQEGKKGERGQEDWNILTPLVIKFSVSTVTHTCLTHSSLHYLTISLQFVSDGWICGWVGESLQCSGMALNCLHC